MSIHAFRDVTEVFGVGDVQTNETGSGMPAHDTASSFLQLVIRREIRAVERPIGMGLQLIPTLVESVNGLEERTGVRGVDRNWNSELPSGVPHGIEALIIHRYQSANVCLLPNKQA